MDLQGKRVLVFGTGKSGIGAADLLEQTGAHVILFDGNENTDKDAVLGKLAHGEKAEIYAGELPKEVEAGLDLVVLSPGVPYRSFMIWDFRYGEKWSLLIVQERVVCWRLPEQTERLLRQHCLARS